MDPHVDFRRVLYAHDKMSLVTIQLQERSPIIINLGTSLWRPVVEHMLIGVMVEVDNNLCRDHPCR